MSLLPMPVHSKEPGRFLRFAVVGVSGTLIDFLLLSLLKAFGLPTLPANTLSYSAGTINNFIWNRRWTFPEARVGQWKKQMAQFVLVSLMGLLLNDLLMHLLEAPLSVWFGYWGYLPAKGLATGVALFWNYLANRFWTFKKYLPAHEQRHENTPSLPRYTAEGQGGNLMNAIAYPAPGSDQRRRWLTRPMVWKITPAALFLGVIVLLSLGLHLYNIQTIGDANNYYTAAVKSMLQSWHNFFFVSAEPGGSVSLDKPPLGFWIEAAFAAGLGLNGLSTALPNILAGVLSIPLLYHLVRKYFGVVAGLTAALVLAITPVTLAVDRNNTIDGMLVFSLLLAAWAFLNATESGKLRYLLLGALLVGLGFNIKMLQAFLPLPAFYALYLLGARAGWRRKFLNLALASVLLLAVSFAWPIAVDRVPPSQRPYVGGTSNNSEMDLIVGYNGLKRMFGRMTGLRSRIFNSLRGVVSPPGGSPKNPQGANNASGTSTNSGPIGQTGGFGGIENIGQPGVFRFFQAPLAKEMSWLLPIAMAAMLLAALSGRIRLPIRSYEHKGLILWGGWLVICLVFFSVAIFFHNYYLATLSPPLAALVGMGVSKIIQLKERSPLLSAVALLAVTGATLAFEYALVRQFGLSGIWVGPAAVLFVVAASLSVLNLVRGRSQGLFFHLANLAALAAILVIPALWSVWTVVYAEDTSQPEAYTANYPLDPQGTPEAGAVKAASSGSSTPSASPIQPDPAMLAYLQANTRDMKYLVAVPSSRTGAPLVLSTGRPVLYMGGYSGSDPVMNARKMSRLVAAGQLRYVVLGGIGSRSTRKDVIAWVQSNCKVIPNFSQPGGHTSDGSEYAGQVLYWCSQPAARK